MHPLEYFTPKTTFKRTRKDVQTGKERVSYVYIKDKKEAKYYHGLQSEHITFELNKPKAKNWQKDNPFTSDKPAGTFRVIDTSKICTDSCEG